MSKKKNKDIVLERAVDNSNTLKVGDKVWVPISDKKVCGQIVNMYVSSHQSLALISLGDKCEKIWRNVKTLIKINE